MQGEIIATGTELITGQVADFNARYAARRLYEAGLAGAAHHHGGGSGPADSGGPGPRRWAAPSLSSLPGAWGPPKTTSPSPPRPWPWIGGWWSMTRSVGPHPPLPGGAPDPLGGALRPPGPDPGRGAAFGPRRHGLRLCRETPGSAPLFPARGAPGDAAACLTPIVLPSSGGLGRRRGNAWAQRTLRLFGISEAQLQEVISQPTGFSAGGDGGLLPQFPRDPPEPDGAGPGPRRPSSETLDRLTAALAREVGDALLGPEEVTLEELVGRYAQGTAASPWRWRSPVPAASSGTASPSVAGVLGLFPGRGGELQQRGQARPAAGAGRRSWPSTGR